MNETFLITGGCGFVGSNLAIYLKTKFPSCRVIAFDNLKRRGSELNVQRHAAAGVEFVHGDIRNKEDFNALGEISVLIEAAAEPSVMAGIDSTPDYVLNTNLVGTINCLNFAVKHRAKFIFLSTSRVYPIARLSEIAFTETNTRFELSDVQRLPGSSAKGIAEDFPLEGARSFYGTSKLSSELLIQEYAEFYGLKAVIDRFGVITGPWQMGKVDQGVIVLWMARHFWKKELSYIGFGGEGKQVRDILHIDDLCSLIALQLSDFSTFQGGIFNAGGGRNTSVSLNELTTLCRAATGNTSVIHSVPENRAGDVPIYITDQSKLTALCGWTPARTTENIVADIYQWLKENESLLKPFLA